MLIESEQAVIEAFYPPVVHVDTLKRYYTEEEKKRSYFKPTMDYWITPGSWYFEQDGHVEKINIDEGRGRKIKIPESISQLTHLHSIKLHANNLAPFPPSFKTLSTLISLTIEACLNCNIKPSLDFSGVHWPNLEYFKLRKVIITPQSFRFDQFPALKTLTLELNDYTVLPESIWHCPNLKNLWIQGFHLTKIPDTLGNLTKLNHLSVQFTRIQELPDSLGSLTDLTWLSLSNNKLIRLPESIGNLSGLETLYIGSNQLKELPRSMAMLTKLTNLSTLNNLLGHVPSGILDLPCLVSYHPVGNPISKYPPSLLSRPDSCIFKDKKFNAWGMNLTELPSALRQYPQITEIYMRDNPLLQFPEWIGELTNLTRINIENSFVSRFPPSFKNLSELRNIVLTNVPITSLSGLPSDFLRYRVMSDMFPHLNERGKALLVSGTSRQREEYYAIHPQELVAKFCADSSSLSDEEVERMVYECSLSEVEKLQTHFPEDHEIFHEIAKVRSIKLDNSLFLIP